jgi:hypothetical protein
VEERWVTTRLGVACFSVPSLGSTDAPAMRATTTRAAIVVTLPIRICLYLNNVVSLTLGNNQELTFVVQGSTGTISDPSDPLKAGDFSIYLLFTISISANSDSAATAET